MTTAKHHIIHSLTTLLSNLHIHKLYWQQLGATSQHYACYSIRIKLYFPPFDRRLTILALCIVFGQLWWSDETNDQTRSQKLQTSKLLKFVSCKRPRDRISLDRPTPRRVELNRAARILDHESTCCSTFPSFPSSSTSFSAMTSSLWPSTHPSASLFTYFPQPNT